MYLQEDKEKHVQCLEKNLESLKNKTEAYNELIFDVT